MKKLLTLLLAASFALGAGCALKPVTDWQSVGGSRADATVAIGCLYKLGEKPQETSAMQKEADLRCQKWGYDHAEKFGLGKNTCNRMEMVFMAGMQCVEWLYTQEYQCIGKGDQSLPPELNN